MLEQYNKRLILQRDVDEYFKRIDVKKEIIKIKKNCLQEIEIPDRKKYHILYCISHMIKNKKMHYVGIHSTTNLYDDYFSSSTNLKRNAMRYGLRGFEFKILRFCKSRKELSNYEAKVVNKKFVDAFNTYNIIIGGEERDYVFEYTTKNYKKLPWFLHGLIDESFDDYRNHLKKKITNTSKCFKYKLYDDSRDDPLPRELVNSTYKKLFIREFLTRDICKIIKEELGIYYHSYNGVKYCGSGAINLDESKIKKLMEDLNVKNYYFCTYDEFKRTIDNNLY